MRVVEVERPDWTRFGFTTGMAAAAAAKAAALLVASGEAVNEVRLDTPDGRRVFAIDVSEVAKGDGGAFARVIKRAGPDRDITDGLIVEVCVKPAHTGIVKVIGGRGVGRVVRPGLALAVGSHAINPAPLEHIMRVVLEILPTGAHVVVSAVGGEALSRKTFNSRLGVVGGLSIIGTSGLVRPMSDTAWQAALLPQLTQVRAQGYVAVVLTPGNLGARAAEDLGCPAGAIAQMGNFAGFMLRSAAQIFSEILLVGHIGKIVKIAAGFENTHHEKTPDRVGLIADILADRDPGLSAEIAASASAETAISLIDRRDPALLHHIARLTAARAAQMAGIPGVGVIVTNLAGKALGVEEKAARMLARFLSCDRGAPC